MDFIINLLIMAVSVMAGAYLLDGVEVKSFGGAVVTALLLGIANATIGAFLNLILTPVNFLTLGLVSWIVSALMFMLVSYFYKGFQVKGFLWAMILGLVVGLVNGLLSFVLPF